MSKLSDLRSDVFKFQHDTKFCSKCSTLHLSSLSLWWYGYKLVDTHRHTYTRVRSYMCTQYFTSIGTISLAGRVIAAGLSRISLSTACCTFVPCYGHMYVLELKAAVADLSKHCCRLLLL